MMSDAQVVALRKAALSVGAAVSALLAQLDAVAAEPVMQPMAICANCGSSKWEPGGMGSLYRRCADCGTVGDPIERK